MSDYRGSENSVLFAVLIPLLPNLIYFPSLVHSCLIKSLAHLSVDSIAHMSKLYLHSFPQSYSLSIEVHPLVDISIRGKDPESGLEII
jgi:hypothetical protein